MVSRIFSSLFMTLCIMKGPECDFKWPCPDPSNCSPLRVITNLCLLGISSWQQLPGLLFLRCPVYVSVASVNTVTNPLAYALIRLLDIRHFKIICLIVRLKLLFFIHPVDVLGVCAFSPSVIHQDHLPGHTSCELLVSAR